MLHTEDTQLSSKITVHALKLSHTKLYQTEKHHWYANYANDTALKVGVYTQCTCIHDYTCTHT